VIPVEISLLVHEQNFLRSLGTVVVLVKLFRTWSLLELTSSNMIGKRVDVAGARVGRLFDLVST